MNENRTKLERFRPILESPFSSVLDLLRPSVLKAVPWLRPWRSVADDLGKHFSDPRLVTAFSFQSKYLGMSPFQCPSLFTILAFLEYEYGIFIRPAAAQLSAKKWPRSLRIWAWTCV